MKNREKCLFLPCVCILLTMLAACAGRDGDSRTPATADGAMRPGGPAALSYPYLNGSEQEFQGHRALAERVAAGYVKVVPLSQPGSDGFGGGAPLQPGSGIVLDPAGWVLTAGHVGRARGWPVRIVLRNGARIRGQVIAVARDMDLALVRTGPLPGTVALTAGRSKNLKRGDWALAIGSPKLAWGVVSLGRIRVGNIGERLHGGGPWSFANGIEIGMLVETGHSGGPLVDAEGRLIGMIAAREAADTRTWPPKVPRIAYAVPIEDIMAWLKRVRPE
jgi:S1-C subfamily serine protease